MKIINLESDKYETLSGSDFFTTEVFEYERAQLKYYGSTVNTAIERSKTFGPLSFTSTTNNLLEWKRCKWDLNTMKSHLHVISTLADTNPGGYRRVKKSYLNQPYFRDRYVKELYRIHNIFQHERQDGSTINEELFWTFQGLPGNKKLFLEKIRHYLNGKPQEFLELYYDYLYCRTFYPNDMYIYQSKSGDLPIIFHGRNRFKTFDREKNHTMNQLRQKVTGGKVLVFYYNSLELQIRQPILTEVGNYDFSKSIFINGKLMSQLSEKEHDLWIKKPDKNSKDFKRWLFELIKTPMFYKPEFDYDRVLLRHLINVRPASREDLNLYTVKYLDNNDQIRNRVVRAFNEEVVKLITCYRRNVFIEQIMEIKEIKNVYQNTG